ncbi:HET domain-containing protein [Microdochium nivale]|nr:HET domain-containing protein [Microdochium nivale]
MAGFDVDLPDYTYAPLSLDTRPFRLARLIRASSREAPLECELINSEIDTGSIDYEAVSYTWGAERDVDVVIVAGQILSISLNLSLVLRDIRLSDRDRTVWIDAVCIDQSNNPERSHQVQQMGDIYRNAQQVLFCIGRPTEMTDTLFAILSNLQRLLLEAFPNGGASTTYLDIRKSGILDQLSQCHYACTSRVRVGFNYILRQAWFFRVWIIQEVANARRGRLYCGSVSIIPSIFVTALHLFDIKVPKHCKQILSMMPGRQRTVFKKPLFLLLQELANSQATDPRDRVWALLDLCSDAEAKTALRPDYTKSEAGLVGDMIAYFCGCRIQTSDNVLWRSIDETLQRREHMHNDVLEWLIAKDDVAQTARLLQHHSGELRITEEILRDAYVRRMRSEELLLLLLGHPRAPILTRRHNNKAGQTGTDKAPIGETLLLYAAGRGDDTLFRRLLDSGVRMDVPSNVYLNITGHFEVSKTYIMPSKTTLRTLTTLECAAATGQLAIIEILLKHKTGLRLFHDLLPRSLELAVANGHTDVARFLLQQGIVEAVNFNVVSHICLVKLAVQNGHLETVKLLLKHRAQELDHGPNMLGSVDKLLAQNLSSPGIVGLAMMSGSTQVLELILSSGFHESKGFGEDLITALEQAVLMPNIDFVQLLLRFGWMATPRCINLAVDYLHNNHAAMNPILDALLDAQASTQTSLDVSVVHNITLLATRDGKEHTCCSRYLTILAQWEGGIDWDACGIALLTARDRRVPAVERLLVAKGMVVSEQGNDRDKLEYTRLRLGLDQVLREKLVNVIKGAPSHMDRDPWRVELRQTQKRQDSPSLLPW